jgi:hypothetical protein
MKVLLIRRWVGKKVKKSMFEKNILSLSTKHSSIILVKKIGVIFEYQFHSRT